MKNIIFICCLLTLLGCSSKISSPENNHNKSTFSSDNIIIDDPTLGEKVKQSVIRTFGKSIEAKLTSVSIQKVPNGNIYTYEYTTNRGQKSTFLVVNNKDLKSSNQWIK